MKDVLLSYAMEVNQAMPAGIVTGRIPPLREQLNRMKPNLDADTTQSGSLKQCEAMKPRSA